MRSLYAFNDSDAESRDYKTVTLENAQEWNKKGYGIFHTVNVFNGSRKIANLKKILAWYADIDDYDKTLEKMIMLLPIYPTMVVKTKSGYHLYFEASDATVVNYKLIGKRIIHALGAKESVYDLARLLRVPGFYHMKDTSNPFLVRQVFSYPASYSEKQMLYLLKPHPEELLKVEEYKPKEYKATGDSYFDKIHSLNQEDLLRQLSGKSCVFGESYSFKPVSGGKKNIFVNGKSTPCWIDRNGKIGSQSGGGPTVIQWLHWLGHDYREIGQILKQEIGEL